jgi:outer membrane protein assembly factor BamB
MAGQRSRLTGFAAAALLTVAAAAAAVNMEVGPYVQFTGPDSAIVRWDTATARNSIVKYGTSPGVLNNRIEDATLKTVHEIAVGGLTLKDKYFYCVGYSDGVSEYFSDEFWFDNAINYTRVDVSAAASPYPPDGLTAIYEQAAERIISQSGITKGICLVYGCGEGRLAFELAKRSDLIIVGVDEDSNKIDTAAQKLMQAGVYGARVTVRAVTSLGTLPFTKYLANLIVSDRMISDGACPGTAAEMFRVLRPSGGVAYLGQPDGCPNELTESELTSWLNSFFDPAEYTITNDSNGLWATVVRDDVPGAGWWSHLYAGAHNNGCSNDALEGISGTGDLDLQWIGWPGMDAGIDRQVRMSSPVAQNGRLYQQGFNRIIAIDSYNGVILWSLEIPQLRRLNVIQDCGNACTDDDYVYVAVKDDCWRLDGNTGIRSLTYKLDDPGRDWGCLFRYGDKLYGSAEVEGAAYTLWWGNSGWYNGGGADQASKICSKYIFADDAATGTRLWTYPTNKTGAIINATIAIGGERVYFVESRHSTAQNYSSGRLYINELWQNQYLVALNPATGAKLWEQPIDTVDGTAAFYLLYANEIVIVHSSDGNHYLYAFNATDGSAKWNKAISPPLCGHSPHVKRGAIVGNTIFCQPKAYSLTDGSEVISSGVPTAECGIFSAGQNFLIYRPHGNITLWNITTKTASSWASIRPGCWLNVIPAGGMVLAPEGGGGCDCYGWFDTSVAFVRAEN